MMTGERVGGTRRPFFKQDGGFSTVGMVLALLITLSLVFTTGQVYKIYALSSRVQGVADACALAAENQVASFYLAAQVCDAMVLTLSLGSVVTAGAGVVALCVPATAGLGEELIHAAKAMVKARDSFSQRAVEGLNAVQRMLPFLACAQAMGVAQQNNTGPSNYVAVAALLPAEGSQIAGIQDDGASRAIDDIESKEGQIAQAARAAEESALQMNEHKRCAWEADCGSSSYCMRERAQTLAGLPASENPSFSSPDTWSFSVALNRARSYYRARYENERPLNDTVDEQANSALRKRFYAYASEQMAQGYVSETEDSFSARFPHLPGSTDEMRATSLYTEEAYPITAAEDGTLTMHAWDGCPQVANGVPAGQGSIRQLDAGGFAVCPACKFIPASMGTVAAASTSIENGFEHHYRTVEEEAAAYQKARGDFEASSAQVKGPVENALERFRSIAETGARARIAVDPPGKYGAVVLAADVGSVDAGSLLPSGFVTSGGVLGVRAALSAATLASESSSEGADALNSLLDGLSDKVGIDAVLPSVAVDAWSKLLRCYTQGYEGVASAIESVLDGIPLVSAAGLGPWAAGKFREKMEAIGLEPVSVDAMKPVVVNTWHVAQADSGQIGSTLSRAKRASAYLAQNEGNPYGALVDAGMDYAEVRFDSNAEAGIEIATVELPGGSSEPIVLEVPSWVKTKGHDYLDEARSRLQELATGAWPQGRRWE